MANKAKDNPNSQVDPLAAAINSMSALNPMQGGAMKAMYVMGTETLQFLSSRMQQDIETQQAMLTCKTLADLQKVQTDFYKKALEDYQAAATRMMGILSASSADAVENAEATTKRKYDDVPL